MSDQKKRIEEGPPIWVESIMNRDEYVYAHRTYPDLVHYLRPVEYDPNYHKGGKWRDGIGKGYTDAEIKIINQNLDNLHNLMKTKKFQKRPDYGPEKEARP